MLACLDKPHGMCFMFLFLMQWGLWVGVRRCRGVSECRFSMLGTPCCAAGLFIGPHTAWVGTSPGLSALGNAQGVQWPRPMVVEQSKGFADKSRSCPIGKEL